MNDTARDTPNAQIAAGWGSDAIADLLRALEIPYIALTPGASFRGLHDSLVNYLGNAQPELLLCVHEESAVALAHGYARVAGSAARRRAARERRADARDDGDLQRVVRSHSRAAARRRRVRSMRSSAGRGSTGSTRRATWARSSAATRNGTTSRARSPQRSRRSCAAWRIATTPPQGPVFVCLDAALQEEALVAPVPLPALDRTPVATTGVAPAEAVREAATAALVRAAPAAHGRPRVDRSRGLRAARRARRASRRGGDHRHQDRRLVSDAPPAASVPAVALRHRRGGGARARRRRDPEPRLDRSRRHRCGRHAAARIRARR